MNDIFLKFGLFITFLVFSLYYGIDCQAQTDEWGIRVNGKEWYYERGEIFRGTKEVCERKCAELNFHPSTSSINVSEVGQRIDQYRPPELSGGSLPSQSMMNDFVNAVDEERRKNANVYKPERITSDNINEGVSHEKSAAEIGKIARENAEFNNDYVTTVVENDPRFTKKNNDFKGTPKQQYQLRPIADVLQEKGSCNCSTLINDTEYKQWAIEFINSGRSSKEFKSFANEKYSTCLNKNHFNRDENDFEIFYNKLVRFTNQEIDKMLVK